jgi:2-polyprenyl-3-methyl-5-hydroxy-6-metoxy-1,4-benzoquinol methylase
MKLEANEIVEQRLLSPDYECLREIKKVEWTSHNIPLTRFESTLGNSKTLIGDEPRTQVIKKNLHLFTGKTSLSGLKLMDLGCLEGGLSFEMAREGMDVTGIEGRESNYLKCRLIKDYFKLQNLNFLRLDVKDLNRDKHGVFDIVLCCGLLYHLDNPFSFLDLINTMTHDKSILFIDTHFAPKDAESLQICKFKNTLSAIETFESAGHTYKGRRFSEYADDVLESNDPWAAISNSKSFWPTKDSLVKALYFSGFQQIYELHGIFEIEYEYNVKREYSRLGMIALKQEYLNHYPSSDLAETLENYTKEIRELKINLETVTDSLIWRAASNFYRLRDRILPDGSTRRIVYNKIINLIKK